MKKICPMCGKTFGIKSGNTRYFIEKQIYCSRKCALKANREKLNVVELNGDI